jgi:transcriptional regulator with GAF, ATPase, and Fis domain
VRELRNLIERAMIVSTGETLELPLPEAVQLRAQNFLFEEMARKHILSVLETTNWRIKGKDGAAQMLGLKPTTLQSKMKKLGIRRMAQ